MNNDAPIHFLSIDLAPTATGWAHFVGRMPNKWGTILVHEIDPQGRWLWDLFEALRASLSWAGLSDVVIEFPERWLRVSTRTSTATLETMYFSCGCAILAAHSMADLHIHRVDPRTWQRDLLSRFPGWRERGAVKDVARTWVLNEYPMLQDLTEHEVDAIAQGAWWFNVRRWDELTQSG